MLEKFLKHEFITLHMVNFSKYFNFMTLKIKDLEKEELELNLFLFLFNLQKIVLKIL